jgi:two-component system CheB/CheR fusion protein
MSKVTLEHTVPAPVGHGHVAQSTLAVIGIGASAGGLEAATRLIKAWPPEASTAFILVQHADPSGGSMMAALLAPHTELTVLEASDGTSVAPGHLYIIPPGRYLSVADGVLHVSAPPSHGARKPFDVLLQSLAEQYGNRAACIVLSGTGTDGTVGVARIKAQGGIVAVQDPMEAGYDGMPTSAVATGMADFVLPIAEIPAALSARLKSAPIELGEVPASGAAPRAPARDVEVTGKGLPNIIELLRAETGNDFTLYKLGTLQRRIGRRTRPCSTPWQPTPSRSWSRPTQPASLCASGLPAAARAKRPTRSPCSSWSRSKPEAARSSCGSSRPTWMPRRSPPRGTAPIPQA